MLKVSEQVKNMIENIPTNISRMIRKEMEEAKITRLIHKSNLTPRTYDHAQKYTGESNNYEPPENITNEHSHEYEEHENWTEVRRRRRVNTRILGPRENRESTYVHCERLTITRG